MTGVELINAMRENETSREIPTIVITSDANRQAVLSALTQGVTGFLLKPFNSVVLKEKVDEAIAAFDKPKS